MTEINLTDPEITDYEIYRFDEYISDICDYLKAYKDDKIKSFQHVCDSCRNDVMIRFYPTNTGHPLRPLSEFVDHIIDQIEGYDCIAPLIGTRCIPFKPSNIIKVSLPKIGSNGTESFIYEYGDDTSPISKLVDYYGSLKQGDDKMIALVYTKIPNLGIVTSEILPYEVKYYKDADSWGNVSIEFIDVFTNKKCTFEFKGDEIMGVNIKDNTSEGAAFEQALAFADKNKTNIKMRISKDEYYLGIAEAVSRRSTCLRIHYGSVMVKHDRIISTGYNGSPTGAPNCDEIGECYRVKNNIPHFTRYETCESVHSEMNAIINASRPDMIDSTLYLVGKDALSETFVEADCCPMCRRAIINAGIKQVVFRTKDGGMRKIDVSGWKTECGFSNKE